MSTNPPMSTLGNWFLPQSYYNRSYFPLFPGLYVHHKLKPPVAAIDAAVALSLRKSKGGEAPTSAAPPIHSPRRAGYSVGR